MSLVRTKLQNDLPELSTYFQTGGLVDAVVNMGLPAPIDVQVGGSNLDEAAATAASLAKKIRTLDGVGDVLVPQDVDYPSLKLDVNREMAGRLGLTSREVVDNVITALASNAMIAPNYWDDPKSGNSYVLGVQYPESQIKSMEDLYRIPIKSPNGAMATNLGALIKVSRTEAPTEVDHYQLRRVIDVYVSPSGQDLNRLATRVDQVIAQEKIPADLTITMRGSVDGMRRSFISFGLGLVLSIVLVYLILMAQFSSFIDPLIILLAIPPGITGVILFLLLTGTTLNVMSLMGVVMMTGIVVSNSILIVEFTRKLRSEGMEIADAVSMACRVRLRPVLMTSLATILGMVPMALAWETGSEQYAPLARAIIGGLAVSVVVTVFVVPAAYLLVHRNEETPRHHGGPAAAAADGGAL
jgi:multidrug efflux pump subunit AcrB